MIEFLSKFLSNLPSIQTRQLLKLLSQKRDSGELRTLKEFEGELEALAKQIQRDELRERTPELAFRESDLLESDAMRQFVQGALLDLEAMLGDVEYISNSARAHHKFLVENHFNKIEAAVVELEKQVKAYEALTARRYVGFQDVRYFDFSGSISVPSALETARISQATAVRYEGYRPPARSLFEREGGAYEKTTRRVVEPSQPSSVRLLGQSATGPMVRSVSPLFQDERGGENLHPTFPRQGEPGLHLSANSTGLQETYKFSDVDIMTDSTTPQTALDTSVEGAGPTQAIDDSRETYWKHSILLDEHVEQCRLKVGFIFFGARRLNAVSIEGVSEAPMTLAGASYINATGAEVDLGLSSTEIKTSGPVVISLGDITTRKLILTFQQSTAVDGEFFYNGDLGSWQKAAPPTLLSAPPPGRETAFSDELLGIFLDSTGRHRARFAEYPFGLKNVLGISREYGQNGIFVTEQITTPSIASLSLQANIDYPTDEYTDVEFSLRKENYNKAGELLDTESFPILPYGTTQITSERLFLRWAETTTSIYDTGQLRFFPDLDESLVVLKNGAPLTIGSHYTISVDGGATWERTTDVVGTNTSPPRLLIKVNSPRSDSIYVVQYTPKLSTQVEGGEIFVNQTKTTVLERFQTYTFDAARAAGEITSCKLSIQVILRANTLNTRVSPFLKDLVLLLGYHGQS